MTKNDITAGTTFGFLTVLTHTDRRSGYNHYFRCRCACGRELDVQGGHLLYGKITSCGCARLRPPSSSGINSTTRRLRQTWRHMLSRCTDPRCKDYTNYGARGITVCAEWLADFNVFKEWALANGYRDDLSLDRIDNDGDYAASNCHWATIRQQNLNTRRVIRVTAFGETKALSEWSEDPRCRVSYSTLHQRVTTLGWEIEAALLNGKHERPQSRAA